MPTRSSARSTRACSSSPRSPEVRRPERDVLGHRRHEQLVVRVLEHDADAPADLAQVLLDHRQARDLHRPDAAAEHPVQVQHQRRLARAVRPEDGDPLALVHPQVDAEQRLVPVRVGERQPGDLQ
jgi:hypothetical protein